MDYSAAVERQRAFFRSGATRPLPFRLEQLDKLHRALVARESECLEALQADLRKSPAESYATEIGFLLSEIRHAARHLPAWMAPHRRRVPLAAWPARASLQPEPHGVALVIGPWNYPLQLSLAPLAGAIAAGNCAIVKPSEYAPRTADLIARLLAATFPEDYVAAALGDQGASEALLREKFDAIFFTGSTRVGRIVMAAAAQHLTPVTLELGGKCPCIVCADAPLDTTARRIVWGKFMNAGQTCVAPDFVLADRRIRAGLVEAMKRALRDFYGDDPRHSPDFGRIVNPRHFRRLAGYLDRGRIAHGGQHDESDLFIAPTILTGVSPGDPVMQEEIFGPILPVLDFDALEDLFRLLRDRPTPLALYLFSKDRAIQERVLASIRSGGACINDTIAHMIGKDLPFGGLGDSGIGAYHGRASFDCFTHWRSVLRRPFAFDPRWRYPPPRVSLPALKRALRFLLRG